MSLDPFAPSPAPLTPEGYQRLGGAHSSRLQGWLAALASRNTVRANIACIGNSVTEGNGASVFSRTWVQQLGPMLNARFPTPGLAAHGRGYLNPAPFDPFPWNPDAYVTNAPALTSSFGFGPALLSFDISTGPNVVTYALNGTAADIMYLTAPGGGVFSWAVDGGAATDVDTNTTFADGVLTGAELGAAGAHTLVLRHVSGGGTFIDGVIESDGDTNSGIMVHGCGFGSTTSAEWLAAAGNVTQPQALAALSPGLIIIELGLNDRASGITPAQTGANLTALIAQQRAAYATPPPFLLLAAYNAALDGPTTPAQWQQYVNAMYQVAGSDLLGQVDVLDLTLRMPSTGAANTWSLYYSDQIHPDDNGHQMIADALCDFLSPA